MMGVKFHQKSLIVTQYDRDQIICLENLYPKEKVIKEAEPLKVRPKRQAVCSRCKAQFSVSQRDWPSEEEPKGAMILGRCKECTAHGWIGIKAEDAEEIIPAGTDANHNPYPANWPWMVDVSTSDLLDIQQFDCLTCVLLESKYQLYRKQKNENTRFVVIGGGQMVDFQEMV